MSAADETFAASAPSVAPADGPGEGRVAGAIDTPGEGDAVSATLRVSGWIFSPETDAPRVEAFLDDVRLGILHHDIERPDVAQTHGYPQTAVRGYDRRFALDAVAHGSHRLDVRVADGHGQERRYSRTILVAESPLDGAIDEPEEGQTIVEQLRLSGWALSTAAPILAVEASIDGIALGPIAYGFERADVVQAMPGQSDRCGFADLLHLDARLSGPRRLELVATDARGNLRTFTREIVVKERSGYIFLDEPTEGEGSSGMLVVRGWTFSRKAPIYNVQVFLGDRLLGPVPHGQPRTDVRDLFDHPYAKNSGFHGILRFPVEQTGSHPLIVRATDLTGEVIETTVTMRVITVDEPVARIERAVWRGGTVDVEGWAIWPHSAFPRTAHLFLDGSPLGETPVHLSRPDIAMRFPNNPEADRSGFRFRLPYPPLVDTPDRAPDLVVEFRDGTGQVQRCSTHLAADPDIPADASAAIATFAAAVAECTRRCEGEPAILDWHTGLELATIFPAMTIFSPPLEDDAPVLPYEDASIDIVVTAHDPTRIAEAERVAALTVLAVGGVDRATPGRDHPRARTGRDVTVERVWWRAEDAPAPEGIGASSPIASIIIPVHNEVIYTQACLARVIATLSSADAVEIIVVDDASTDDTIVVLHRRAALDRRIRILRNERNSGFLRSCNRGAEAATGKTLVFLNNDTLPEPGWLPALLRTFREYPDAGAVGGKLVYPDGTLQEAGGVVFSDGSGYNFGRNDTDVDASLYTYVREVDYCSGALLATRRSLFRELGGFDTRYDPAYYEDVDYAFALRERGYRVYYQPESVAVHFEGRSSGTDIAAGVKRHQATNRVTFVAKWREALRRQPAPTQFFDRATRHALAVRDAGEGRPDGG